MRRINLPRDHKLPLTTRAMSWSRDDLQTEKWEKKPITSLLCFILKTKSRILVFYKYIEHCVVQPGPFVINF